MADHVVAELFVILVGVFSIVVGAYLWRLARKTPEGKLIPRPWGVWWSHERTYATAVLLWLVGLLCIIGGIIL